MDMKKRILSSIILAIGLIPMAYAQIVQENELAVVYYMPATELAVTVDYDKVVVEPGPFYLYAERYLGVKNVATEAITHYEVTNITLTTRTVADTTRVYKVVDETPWISLTPEGLLYGYNIPSCNATTTITNKLDKPTTISPALMPLMEEQMIASTIAKMAEGAAKQIYHIREIRMNLLAGDVEHAPYDGQSMQLVLNELDKREQMLAELFVGARKVEHHSHTIYYKPAEDVNNHVIGRISQYAGIVSADDLSGEPIQLTLNSYRQTYAPIPDEEVNKKKKTTPSQLYYNLPGYADIVVSYGDQIQVSTTMPIAQFGIAIPLSKKMLSDKQTTQIYFNTQTGNILSITK